VGEPTTWQMIGLVALAGAIGGVINVFITNDTVVLPHRVADTPSWQLGILGNILTGAAAGSASWALYGPYSLVAIAYISLAHEA
jgi:hypothetical protein